MGRFADWKIDGYTATSPDGKYQLWIANGFAFFKDNEPHLPRQTLLASIGLLNRYRLWREIKAERKQRFNQFMQGQGV